MPCLPPYLEFTGVVSAVKAVGIWLKPSLAEILHLEGQKEADKLLTWGSDDPQYGFMATVVALE